MRQPLLMSPIVRLLGADRQLEPERRALCPTLGFHPDAPAVHLDDALGDGEAEAGAALLLGIGAVDLLELLEDARLLAPRDARAGIGDRDHEAARKALGLDRAPRRLR